MDCYETDWIEDEDALDSVQKKQEEKKQEEKKQEAHKRQSDNTEFASVMPVMMFIVMGIGMAFLFVTGLR